MQLVSIQVGQIQQLGTAAAVNPLQKPWVSAFFKAPVTGPLVLTTDGLSGDHQADRKNHGGPDKLMLAYAARHYDYWRNTLQLPGMPYGAFGENLTIDGLTEQTVCVGDVYSIGPEVVVQVSQPREPCWKLARRWQLKDLPKQVIDTGYTGWYFRALKLGFLEHGMGLALVDRPCPDWSIQKANQVMHFQKNDPQANWELSQCPALSIAWRDALLERA
jgi:MOSC domain-containing protein YiiM